MWLLAACQQGDTSVLAQVGEERLLSHDVLIQMPLKCTGQDSVLFVQNYVNEWVDEQLLFQQGLKNVSNLDQLEKEVVQYRRDLIARTYQAEKISIYNVEVTEEQCLAFYEENKRQLKLQYPIIKGFYVKVLSNSSKVKDLKDWLKQIKDGNMDHAEELEQFCQQRAVDYDSFTEQWVDMRRLTDRLPTKVYDAASFLHNQVYQMKDKEYIYVFMISDFRLDKDIQPFDFCRSDIYEMLIQQNQLKYRKQLQQELRDEALRTGFLKLN